MSLLSDWKERARSLVSGDRQERELREEMEVHIQMETEKNLRAGMGAEEARRKARVAFGGVDSAMEGVRDASGVRPLDDFTRDVRHSLRTLGRHPGFTTVTVATLAIGIGASTAMFTLVDSVLLRPLPYADPDRLLSIAERPPSGAAEAPTSPRSVTAWRQQSASFESIAAYTDRPFTLRDQGSGEAAEVRVRLATSEYFDVLRARALHGSTLFSTDAADRVVLSHALWQSRYGGDPAVVGRAITLNDEAHFIVGVMPRDFRSVGGRPEMFASMRFNNPAWPGRYLSTIARLRPGVTEETARAEMATIGARMAIDRPDSHKNWSVTVASLQERVTGEARPALLVLLAAVSLLLLIACANVANLFLGRAVARRKEMAVRRSLGASRRRLIQQTMTEAIVVATIAGVCGVLLAYWGTGAVVRALPPDLALPRLDEVSIDPRVLAFALGVSLVTGVLFGAAPAVSGSAVDPAGALRETSRGVAGGRARLRRALVVGEVALAVTMLAGAGLLVRTVQNLMSVDAGVRGEGVLAMRLNLAGERYREPASRRAFVRELLERLSAVPGTTAAGTTSAMPLAGAKSANFFHRNDRPLPAPGEELGADYRVVGGRYFEAIGIPLIRGRVFDAGDDENAPPRFIVNEALAERYFPGEDAVGKHITYEWYGPQSGEIVGVVGSVREMALDEAPSPAVYRPLAQDPSQRVTVVLRAAVEPLSLGHSAAAVVRDVDPALPPPEVRTLEELMTGTLSRQRLTMFLLVGFAAVSLLLVVIGLYGIVAYSVAQRTRELGIRMALGAQRSDVLRMVIGEGMALGAAGVVIGLGGALALRRLPAGLLYGVTPTDPGTFVAVAIVLGATTLLASYLPASRASRINPAGVLGAEN